MIKRKIAALLLATTVMSQIFGSQVSYAKDNAGIIIDYSLDDASIIALNHVKSTVDSSNKSNLSTWSNNTKIVSKKALFDLNENVSAYLFKLGSENKEDEGYIIISAKTSDTPIVEFGYGDSCFIDEALEKTKENVKKSEKKNVKRNNSKVYYLGGLTYLAQHKLEDNSIVDYDISSAATSKVEKEDYSNNEEFSTSNNGSSSSNRNDIIEWPSTCENGKYNSVTTKTITKGYRDYFTMNQFSEGGVCYPTAATNLLYYWYNRDNK